MGLQFWSKKGPLTHATYFTCFRRFSGTPVSRASFAYLSRAANEVQHKHLQIYIYIQYITVRNSVNTLCKAKGKFPFLGCLGLLYYRGYWKPAIQPEMDSVLNSLTRAGEL